MKGLFYWIRDDPDQIEQVDNLVYQLEYDHYVAPFLTEEIEINEIVSENGAFVSRKRKVKVLVDVVGGESFDGGILY